VKTRTEWTCTAVIGQRKRSINTKKLKTKIDDVLKYMFVEDLFEERETNNPLSNENGKYLEGKEARIL
jgi:hypothetical protein